MFLCPYSPYPCNSKPLTTVYTHVFTTGCLYIYYVHLPNAGCTTHVVSHPLLPHHPPPIPPSYLPPADLKQMGPPLCAVVLLKVPSRDFFLAPVAIVLALR